MELSIIKIKILVEAMLYFYDNQNIDNFKEIFTEISNNYFNKIHSSDIITTNFLNELKNYKKTKMFYEIKKKIDNYYK